ncbi:MAG: hypothetical protein KatS3mg087_1093 [Patescibacteria group bacterium]|nr:MAG: hypothetical protein KatS3mg087_1093 [Patescibacteria group bacterium]
MYARFKAQDVRAIATLAQKEDFAPSPRRKDLLGLHLGRIGNDVFFVYTDARILAILKADEHDFSSEDTFLGVNISESGWKALKVIKAARQFPDVCFSLRKDGENIICQASYYKTGLSKCNEYLEVEESIMGKPGDENGENKYFWVIPRLFSPERQSTINKRYPICFQPTILSRISALADNYDDCVVYFTNCDTPAIVMPHKDFLVLAMPAKIDEHSISWLVKYVTVPSFQIPLQCLASAMQQTQTETDHDNNESGCDSSDQNCNETVS